MINAHEWNSTFFRGLKYVNSGVEGARETVRMAGELRGGAGSSRPQGVKDARGRCGAAEGARGRGGFAEGLQLAPVVRLFSCATRFS